MHGVLSSHTHPSLCPFFIRGWGAVIGKNTGEFKAWFIALFIVTLGRIINLLIYMCRDARKTHEDLAAIDSHCESTSSSATLSLQPNSPWAKGISCWSRATTSASQTFTSPKNSKGVFFLTMQEAFRFCDTLAFCFVYFKKHDYIFIKTWLIKEFFFLLWDFQKIFLCVTEHPISNSCFS